MWHTIDAKKRHEKRDPIDAPSSTYISRGSWVGGDREETSDDAFPARSRGEKMARNPSESLNVFRRSKAPSRSTRCPHLGGGGRGSVRVFGAYKYFCAEENTVLRIRNYVTDSGVLDRKNVTPVQHRFRSVDARLNFFKGGGSK